MKTNNHIRQLALLFTCIAILSGCATPPVQHTQRLYTGAPQPSQETAVLIIGPQARILSVDGSPVLAQTTRIELLPGKHLVIAEFSTAARSVDSGAANALGLPGGHRFYVPGHCSEKPLKLEIETEKMRSYVAKGDWNAVFPTGPATVEISDSPSGRVVAKAGGRVKERLEE